MTKAQESLKADIEKIRDDTTIEKVRILILGILAQQNITENFIEKEEGIKAQRKENAK